MKRNAIAFLFISLTAVGCASSPTTPDWVSGAPAKYPPATYLIGRGEAASGEEARDRARADLAKTLEVDVAVESEDVQAFKSAAGGQYEGSSSRRITTRAEQLVEGIEIAETWNDPKTGTAHALAVLPRLKAGTALRAQIGELDDATRLQMERARTADDLLTQIACASRAVVAQSERAAYQKTLRVVDPAGVGESPTWNIERLRADLDALLKRVKLASQVTDDPSAGGLEPIVKGAVAHAGFLADTGQTPAYVLEASLALEDLGLQEGWYWRRGVLEVRLLESASGRVRGTKRWPIKTSASTSAEALRRALDMSDQLLKKELRGTLIGFTAGTKAG